MLESMKKDAREDEIQYNYADLQNPHDSVGEYEVIEKVIFEDPGGNINTGSYTEAG